MSDTGTLLVTSALTLGVTHTLIGLDHSLPFIVIGRARGWSLPKVLVVTATCGLGHVLSSVVLGVVGLSLGWGLARLSALESARGALAVWALIAFGAVYAAWGLWRSRRGARHAHWHVHADGTAHAHAHPHPRGQKLLARLAPHAATHAHRHALVGSPSASSSSGPAVLALVVIFVLGPCEALIPLLLVPALQTDVGVAALVTAVFGGATLLTMLAAVALGYAGLRGSWAARLEPHLHMVAGVTIALTGVGMHVLAF